MTFKIINFYPASSSWINSTYTVATLGADEAQGVAIEFNDGYIGVWMGMGDDEARLVAQQGASKGTFFNTRLYGTETYKNVDLV